MRRLALIVGVGLAVALPATNASGGGATSEKRAGSRCPDGSLCLWTHPNYEGRRLEIEKRKLSNRIYRFEGPDGPFNDAISSLKLRKSGTALLYEDTNGEGLAACFVGPHANQANLADVSFDDIASSSEIPKNPRLAC